ncbi:hypothetical protein TNCV_4223041 [Trichonephila clavipes]|nr:hypothetical protein TNCV_4223041 [Trichonephila clavipes]
MVANSFHAASSVCPTLSTIVTGERSRSCFSAVHDEMFSVGQSLDKVLSRATPSVSKFIVMSTTVVVVFPFCIAKGSCDNGSHALCPRCSRRRETVYADTCVGKKAHFKISDVATLSSKTDLAKNMSCRELMVGGR